MFRIKLNVKQKKRQKRDPSLTFSFSPSKRSSSIPSTPLAANSDAYSPMLMAVNHRHTCSLLHSATGRFCHMLLLLEAAKSSSSV